VTAPADQARALTHAEISGGQHEKAVRVTRKSGPRNPKNFGGALV
jgi:hypothetical protein